MCELVCLHVFKFLEVSRDVLLGAHLPQSLRLPRLKKSIPFKARPRSTPPALMMPVGDVRELLKPECYSRRGQTEQGENKLPVTASYKGNFVLHLGWGRACAQPLVKGPGSEMLKPVVDPE